VTDKPFTTVLPIFPLSGAMLLPGAELPLFIFEPRYRAMVSDALEGKGMIGMVQPITAAADPTPDDAKLFSVGCAGEVAHWERNPDGTYKVILSGMSRFKIAEELEMVSGYRRVTADFSDYAADLERLGHPLEDEPAGDRERLDDALEAYLTANGIEVDMGDTIDMPDAMMVNALAMTCPFSPREKQALLEAVDTVQRAELLIALLEMGAIEGEGLTSDRPQ